MDPQSVFAIKYLLQVMVWTCEKSEKVCKERFKKEYEDWYHTKITWIDNKGKPVLDRPIDQ
jgi:hypothetical protein